MEALLSQPFEVSDKHVDLFSAIVRREFDAQVALGETRLQASLRAHREAASAAASSFGLSVDDVRSVGVEYYRQNPDYVDALRLPGGFLLKELQVTFGVE